METEKKTWVPPMNPQNISTTKNYLNGKTTTNPTETTIPPTTGIYFGQS